MLHLPAIPVSNQPWRLPLSDHTAVRLAAALLQQDDSACLERLRTIALEDPALALWSVCFAWREHAQVIESADEAVNWLRDYGVGDVVEGLDDSPQDEGTGKWQDCVRESIHRRLSAEATNAEAEHVALQPFQALLMNLPQWLKVQGFEKDALDKEIAPPWLVDRFKRGSANCDDESASIDKKAKRLLSLWESEQPAAKDVLQRACAMQHRLRQLEDEWDVVFLREKLASLKEFTYGASHELNNPLFNISSRAQVLLRDEEDPERRRKLSTIYAHAMRASEMINEIALAARPPQPEYADVEILELTRGLVAEFQPFADEQGAALLHVGGAEPFVIEADRLQLEVAVREIVINSLESLKRTTRRGEVSVATERVGEGQVEIAVTDNGAGMDARARRHLFDPFFSGYESGRGLGFGLTKCWQIVQAHQGTILVDSQPDRSTTVSIRLPTRQPRPDDARAEAAN